MSAATATHDVTLISQADLRRKLATPEEFLLVMAMDRGRFARAHIAGSISYDDLLEILPDLPLDTEIVMYCTDPACAATKLRANLLAQQGFSRVHRYPGGLAEWTAEGLPVVSR